MYTRSKQFIKSSTNASPNLFIEGYDLFNSELAYKLDKETNRKLYLITQFENRIDLISNDIYKTSEYSWILLYINRIKIGELMRGTYIEYIDADTLKGILNSV